MWEGHFDNLNFNSNFYCQSLENRHIFILVFKRNFLLSDIPHKSLNHIPTIPILTCFIHVKTKIFLFLIICISLTLFSLGNPICDRDFISSPYVSEAEAWSFLNPKTSEIYWLCSLRISQVTGQLVFRLSLASGT